MHAAAMAWVAEHATTEPVTVLDIGGRDVNGSPRLLFPCAHRYRVVDLHPGLNVDEVCDILTWASDETFDVVVCCEVFEHTPDWRAILDAAYAHLNDGGTLIVTAAGTGRTEHSAVDGGPLRTGEHYANVTADDLAAALERWSEMTVDCTGDDIRAVAIK